MIVEIKQLLKRYGDTIAVDHVSLSIKEGEIFGLLGPNGAGKTSTISILAGFARMDDGEVNMFNRSLLSHEMEIKRQLGVVPQEIAVFEDLNVQENLTFFGRIYGLKGAKLKANVDAAMEFTGLTDKRTANPKTFSGGMKRRLNIACAIVHQPKLIIFDEPTVGIDPQSRNHILQSIKQLNREGSTVIYTSHYMEEVEELCTRLVILDHGRIIASGTSEELKDLVSSEDRITVEVSLLNYTFVDCVKRLPGVRDCTVSGQQVTITMQKQAFKLAQLLECASSANSEIVSFYKEKPTLEQVFLTLTGRSLRD